MKVSSTTTSQAQPVSRPQQVGHEANKVQEQKAQQNKEQQDSSVVSEKFKSHGNKVGMSTEDFLQLHNSSAEDMLDAVKDVMALKVMEKTLEVIDKIVSD